jgi:hypothetical protein
MMPFPKDDFVASIIAAGEKPSRAAIAVDELLPPLTNEELEVVRLYIYALLSPAERQEALHEVGACPLCKRWMGHNRPPADDEGDPPPPVKQTSFEF